MEKRKEWEKEGAQINIIMDNAIKMNETFTIYEYTTTMTQTQFGTWKQKKNKKTNSMSFVSRNSFSVVIFT